MSRGLGDVYKRQDYINCPLDKEQYETFIDALIASDQTEFKEFEKHALF